MITVEILHQDLPLETALRAAAERGHVLQCDGRKTVIAPMLLPGYTRIVGGGVRNQPLEVA